MTTPAPDYSGLIERLEGRRKLAPRKNRLPTFVRRNPDGPEAAAAIRALEAERERLREALNATSKRNRTLARDLRMKKLTRAALSGGKGTTTGGDRHE